MSNEKLLEKLQKEIDFIKKHQRKFDEEGTELSDYSKGYLKGLEIVRNTIIKGE